MFIHEAFYCVGDLVDKIFDSGYIDDVAIVCKYDTAKYVIKEMLNDSDLIPYSIDLEDPLWDGYTKEFLISTNGDELFCEKFYRNEKYLLWGDNILFILPDCDKECSEYIKKTADQTDVCFEVEFTCNDCEDTDDADDIDVIRDDDGNAIGFTKTIYNEFDDGSITSTISVITRMDDVLKKFSEAFGVTI